MQELTKRQQEIYDFIRRKIRERGYPPSVREIGEAVGLSSSSTVHGHLERLEERGYIRRDPTKPRAIEILDPDDSYRSDRLSAAIVTVPLLGQVTAGRPILAVENIEDNFPFSKELIGGSDDVFMLRVKGDSMINAGILDGDHVIVRRQATADNGDIVVALLDDEATVKRFFREHDYVRLQPENDHMVPIITQSVSVLGKVIGLFRKM